MLVCRTCGASFKRFNSIDGQIRDLGKRSKCLVCKPYTGRKSSLIWTTPLPEFSRIVKDSSTYMDVLSHFGLINKGQNFVTLKRRIVEDSVDDSHILKGKEGSVAALRRINKKQILSKEEALKTFFQKNSKWVNRRTLKRYIKRYSLIPYQCSLCSIVDTWNGSPIAIQLDHEDGNDTNNDLSNLRWLCPNCHSQTSTFAGKNHFSTRPSI